MAVGERVIFPSAPRTGDTVSDDLSSTPEATSSSRNDGCHIIIDVTAKTGTPSVVPTIEGKDPASGKYYPILIGVPITDLGTTVLKVLPAASPIANAVANDQLPATWRMNMNHDDTDSITYSVGAVLF